MHGRWAAGFGCWSVRCESTGDANDIEIQEMQCPGSGESEDMRREDMEEIEYRYILETVRPSSLPPPDPSPG